MGNKKKKNKKVKSKGNNQVDKPIEKASALEMENELAFIKLMSGRVIGFLTPVRCTLFCD